MNIAGIYDESISNGLGWRFVIFVSGCPHHCPSCQNEKAQDFNYGSILDEENILNRINNNSIIKGVTFSGGEPLCEENVATVYDLLMKIKKMRPELNYWCYTGYTFEELLSRNDKITTSLLKEIDVLVDGRFILALKDEELYFKGSSNQRIIDLKKTFQENKIVELSF